jgi:UDP-glucose 4-epimerase
MKRTILVTGGAGNIGGALVSRLTENPDNYVVIVDNLITGKKEKLPPRERDNWTFIQADANDYQKMLAIMTSNRFDYVFHYAAMVGVKRTIQNPLGVLDDIQGIRHTMELAKNTGVKRVFFSSSSEVYGEPVEIPQHEETTPLNARLPYAIVKNVGEAYLRSYQETHGLDYTIFRFFNTYGPKQSEDFVMVKFIKAALEGKDLTVYGDGSQQRTFCYVDDNIDTCLTCLYDDKCINETLNIGSDKMITIFELAELIIRLTGSSSKIVHLPPLEKGDMQRRQPDSRKMAGILNRELVPLEEGIRRMIKHLTERASQVS